MKHWKNYHVIVTPLRFKIGLVVDIIFCLVSVGVIVIARKIYRAESVAAVFISTSYLFFLTAVALIYARAYKSMVSRLNAVESFSTTSKNRVDRDFAKAAAVILLSLVITYAPFCVCLTIHELYKQNNVVKILMMLTTMVAFCNAGMNALIFIMYNRQLKDYLQGICRKDRSLQHDSSN